MDPRKIELSQIQADLATIKEALEKINEKISANKDRDEIFNTVLRRVEQSLQLCDSTQTKLETASLRDTHSSLNSLVTSLQNLLSLLPEPNFPHEDIWRRQEENQHREKVAAFEEEENLKKQGNLSLYDSQPGISPTAPDTSSSEYIQQKSAHESKVASISIIRDDMTELAKANNQLSAAATSLGAELTQRANLARIGFLQLLQQITGDLVFWKNQGKGAFTSKEPEGISKIRKILSNCDISNSESTSNAIKTLREFGETKLRHPDKGRSEVTDNLYKALKTLEITKLESIQQTINDSKQVLKKSPRYRPDDKL